MRIVREAAEERFDVDLESAYRTFGPMVRAAAVRILRDETDADDVVQIVFTRMWAAPNRFHEGRLELWIRVLTKHCAIDMIRSRRRERSRTETLKNMLVAPDAEAYALARLSAASLWRAVSALPPAQRDALVAAYYLGYSHAHIARTTGISLGTVKSRIRSGIVELRSRRGLRVLP